MNPRARRALKKIIWLLAIVLVVFGLPYFIFFVYLPRKAEGEVQKARERIAAAGDPVLSAELAGRKIPEAENAAPLYRQAYASMKLSYREQEIIDKIIGGELSLDDPAVAQDVQAILQNNAAALKLFHWAAAMPDCDFEFNWDKGPATIFHDYKLLRAGADLMALEGITQARAGELEAALDTYVDILRVSEAANDPMIMGQIVRCNILSKAKKSLGKILETSVPSAAQCREAARAISQIELRDDFIRALKGERASGITMFEMLRREGYLPNVPQDIPLVPNRIEEAPSRLLGKTALGRYFIAKQELLYLEAMEEIIAEADQPYRLSPAAESASLGPGWRSNPNPARQTSLSAQLVPLAQSLVRHKSWIETVQATLDLSRIALLLKAGRAETGEYPASLEALAVYMKEELPHDPFSGQSYIYRREGDGFLLYSIGANLKDDGGVPTPPKGDIRKTGDIIIRCEN